MADWGLYSALRGTDDWQTKRQDKQLNLLAAEKRSQVQQKKVIESAAAEQDIAKYMEEMQNLKVLPEDQERVSQAEKQSRQKIVAGIANANGDLRKYMSTGGITALSDYKTSVMQSDEVKQAGANTVSLGNYIAQEKKGNQRHKFVDVTVPMMGEDGQPMLDESGKQVSETKKMTFQDQYDLYKAGKIKNLSYNGSETRIKLGIEDFGNQYKNMQNIYQDDNYVTESNVFEKAISEGASEEYAREQAKIYGNMAAKGGDPWRWKAGDKNDLALKMGKLQLMRDKASAKAKAAAERKLTATATTNVVGEINKLKDGDRLRVGDFDRKAFMSQLGFKQDKDTKKMLPPPGLMAYDQLKPGDSEFSYDIGKAQDIQFLDYVALKGPDGITQRYVRAQVQLPDPTSLMGGAFSLGGDYANSPFDDVFGYTSVKDKSIEKNWQMDSDNNYFTGTTLIPIGDLINTPHIKMEINKAINLNNNAEYTAGTASNEDMQQETRNTFDYWKSVYPKWSTEEILEGLMTIKQEDQLRDEGYE